MADRLTGFSAPSFDDLLSSSRNYYASWLASNPMLRRGVIAAMAHVDAMLASGFYGYLDWIAAQTLPLWAAGGNLDAWGRMIDVPRKGALRASGSAVITGADGRVAPKGALLSAQSADDVLYRVIEDAPIVDGVATLQLVAVNPGDGGNRVPGEVLTLVESIGGIDPSATVVSLTGGREVELDGAAGVAEHYRGRVLDRLREPPQGGSEADHRRWAKDTPDVAVTRVWVIPASMTSNVVWVRFMTDGATPDGIPTVADVQAVAAYMATKKPVTEMDLRVVAPVPQPLDFTIYDLYPDTAAIRAAIAAEVADMILREGYPGCTIYPAWITEAISTAAGEGHHDRISVTAPIVYPAGTIPVAGGIDVV